MAAETRGPHPRVDKTTRQNAQLIVGLNAPRQEPGHHHAVGLHLALDAAALLHHQRAVQREGAAEPSGHHELAVAAHAAFDGQSCFNSARHGGFDLLLAPGVGGRRPSERGAGARLRSVHQPPPGAYGQRRSPRHVGPRSLRVARGPSGVYPPPPPSKPSARSMMPGDEGQLRDEADLLAVFTRRFRPEARLVGMESERIGLFPDGAPLRYADSPTRPGVARLFAEMEARRAGPRRPRSPAGRRSCSCAASRASPSSPAHHLSSPARRTPRPTRCTTSSSSTATRWPPSPRRWAASPSWASAFTPSPARTTSIGYKSVPIMRAYLPTRGAYGLDMMRRTATVQANSTSPPSATPCVSSAAGLALSPSCRRSSPTPLSSRAYARARPRTARRCGSTWTTTARASCPSRGRPTSASATTCISTCRCLSSSATPRSSPRRTSPSGASWPRGWRATGPR